MSNPEDFVIENGILNKYIGLGGNVVIPNGVTEIGASAFSTCRSINLITIPESVTRIGYASFLGCSSLETVTIPSGVKVIPTKAFENCFTLTDVIIPEGVTRIGDHAFYNCTNLLNTMIPKSVTTIDKEAFCSCDSLKNLNIPENTKSIGDFAFSFCGSLTDVTVSENIENIGKECFSFSRIRAVRIKRWSSSISKLFNKCQIEQIITEDFQSVPPKLKPKAALGYLFEMAHSQDIDAGQSNAVMEFFRKRSGKLFNDFSEYPEVWPWLCENGLIKAEEIDSFTTEAQKLENTVLIGLLLNYQNELGIKNVHKARENKEKNREKYSDELNARMVARATAKGIEGLTFSITGKTSFWKSNKEIQDYLALYGAKLSSSVTKNTDYLVRIDPEDQSDKVRKANELGVMVIDQADFFDMIGGRYKDAPEITIPEWIREIPNRAFMGCTTLSKVTIPEGVTNIGEEVFDDCVCLESVSVPISVIHIGKNCFKSTAFYKKSSNWESGILYCGNALIKAKRNIRGECFLKKSTRSIADGAFQSCGSLTSVKIPAGVKSIGSAVFKNCSSLSNVIIPDSVTEIGESAFADCSSLESVIIPDGVKSIRNAAFKNCSELSNVIVPDSVTEIGESAFSGCCSLKNISVPEGVKEIKVSAFEECSSLEAFRIPKGTISIGFYAFYNCRNLKCVTISENVKEINKWSFCNCPSLIIHAPSGSYAEKYATENSIPFVAEG